RLMFVVLLFTFTLCFAPSAHAYDGFPTTGILDNFNRANEGPPPSSNWTDIENGMEVVSNECVGTTASGQYNASYWDASTFGPAAEAYVTITAKPGTTGEATCLTFLFNADPPDGYEMCAYNDTGDTDYFEIERLDDGSYTELDTFYQEFSVGDSIGFSMLGGVLTAYHKPSGGSWYELFSVYDDDYSAVSYLTLWLYEDTATADDFGGGTISKSAQPIYRSVGFGSTAALESGTGNDLTISGSTATFDVALGNSVGVGDVIQYDADADGDIDGNDAVCFIHGRTSSTVFTVKTASGSPPRPVTDDEDWSLFRAYTSLSLAEEGDENNGMDNDVESFELWSGGKDLVDEDEQWNIACYGDAVDTTILSVSGWTTDSDNYLKIFTPVSSSEVGTTQRHTGVWSAGAYTMKASDTWDDLLTVSDNYVHIEGIQIDLDDVEALDGIFVSNSGDGSLVYNCIIKNGKKGYGGAKAIEFADYSQDSSAINNIIYDTEEGIYVINPYNEIYLYNNTIYNCDKGIYVTGSRTDTYAFNNLAYDNTTDFDGNYNAASDYNFSKDDTAPDDGNSIHGDTDGATPDFVSTTGGSEDLHLQSTSDAIDAGDDLSGTFTDDIDGDTRSDWDIGADEYVAGAAAAAVDNAIFFGTNF
ncbi:right-handed parallel beta-helix repeat-containing protein, partial [Candidatus Omnitrophota bacterium]